MLLYSKSYKSINNWNFWPNLWPVNYQKETLKININYWLRIKIENDIFMHNFKSSISNL